MPSVTLLFISYSVGVNHKTTSRGNETHVRVQAPHPARAAVRPVALSAVPSDFPSDQEARRGVYTSILLSVSFGAVARALS